MTGLDWLVLAGIALGCIGVFLVFIIAFDPNLEHLRPRRRGR